MILQVFCYKHCVRIPQDHSGSQHNLRKKCTLRISRIFKDRDDAMSWKPLISPVLSLLNEYKLSIYNETYVGVLSTEEDSD